MSFTRGPAFRHGVRVDEPQRMPQPPEHEIAGYRVLRRIARGGRTEVLLAHGGEPPATVVLKLASPDDPGAFREAAALDRGAGEHVVPLLDVHGDDDRVVLVLPRLPNGDLGRLLAERTELAGGEAVTILAPIAATLRRLHRAGVAHGALIASAVLFDEEGAPTLTGFGAAAIVAAGAPEVDLEQVPEIVADRAALRGIASAVLERVGGERRAAARRLLSRINAERPAEVAALIAEEVFGVAAAQPVRSDDAEPMAAWRGSATGRPVPVADPIEAGPSSTPSALWERVAAALERAPAAELRTAVSRRWATLSPAWRRVVLAVGAGALALGVALVAIPNGTASRAAVETASPHAWPAPTIGSSSATDGPASGSTAADVREAAVRGDDPVAAAVALLDARAACRRALSVLCLEQVDQDGSAAAQTDRDALRAAQTGGELGDDPLASGGGAPRLIERAGGSALIGLDGGASMLLVDGEDGWRIRDALPAPAQTTTPSPEG